MKEKMIFVQVDGKLRRVARTWNCDPGPRFVLIDRDGHVTDEFWPRNTWRFYTGHVAALLTLVFLNHYPRLSHPGYQSRDDIIRAIPRNLIKDRE